MAEVSQSRPAPNPLLALAVFLSGGIVAGHFLAGRSAVYFKTAVVLLTVNSVLLLVSALRRQTGVASVLMAGAFLLSGLVLAVISSAPLATNRISYLYDAGEIGPGEAVEVTGLIAGPTEDATDNFYFPLRVERLRIRNTERVATGLILFQARAANAQLKREYESLNLTYGARLRVMTTLEREDDFRNPGVSTFTEFLQRKGFDALGTIKSPLLVERLDNEPVFLPLAWLYDWRAAIQKRFHQLFSPETAGVLDASLLGNGLNISLGTGERLRAGGTFHVLVISGFQIAFIGGVALLFASWFTRRRTIQSLCAAGFLWAYTLAVGAEPSVTRSAFMFTLVVLAPVVSRRASTLNCLGGAAIVLLVWRPDDLFDPSFQLTFLSVLSILTIAVPIVGRMREVGSWRPTHETPYPPDCPAWFRSVSEILFWREREWKTELQQSTIRYRLFKHGWALRLDRWRLQTPLRLTVIAIVVPASVQIGMLPILIIYFHRLSFASLFLNIVVGFLMAILSLGAVAVILIAAVSHALAAPLILACEKINWLMIHLVDPFSRLGLASLRVPHYHGALAFIYVVYFLLLGDLVSALRGWSPLKFRAGHFLVSRRTVLAAAGFVVLFAVIVWHPFSAPRQDGKFHVDFLDVGQGDSALLTMPDGTTLLIDGGGRPSTDWRRPEDLDDEEPFQRDTRSIGERVVSEFLWARGVDQVDYLLATHADADHIDGLSDVARNFKVRAALVARAPANDPGYARFAQTMNQSAVPVQQIAAGDELKLGSVVAQVLWPRAIANESAPSRNNDSIVLRFTFGSQTILFTGDVEKEAELALVATAPQLKSSLVKVAHHGSKTSSVAAFVAATHPDVAIISVGRTSVFGHPNKDVVERWRASGAQVMTTGQKGTISVVLDGSDLTLGTFVP